MREVMPLQGSLSIERMCELTRVSRASFYHSFREKQPVEEEMEVRSAIQEIAVEHRRRYGYRRISAELRRRGMHVNRPVVPELSPKCPPAYPHFLPSLREQQSQTYMQRSWRLTICAEDHPGLV
jgi:hypothetical protein